MNTLIRNKRFAMAAILTVFGLASPLASAQQRGFPIGVSPYFQVAPGLTINQAAYNTALLGRAYSAFPPYAFGYNRYAGAALGVYGNPAAAALYSNPYSNPFTATMTSVGGLGGNDSGYSPYSNPYGGYYETPLGGYLRGIADVINSESRSLINVQQANLLRQQVQREKIENRRRIFDQYLYEREKMPTAEDDRQKSLQEIYRRSMNDPPVGDIVSAQALNTLLAVLQKKMDKDFQGPQISLDEDVVRHINVKPPSGDSNPGLLKNEGRLSWPLVLRGPLYAADREILNDLTPNVYDQAITRKVESETMEKMTAAVKRLNLLLADNIKDLTPAQYSEARRFLTNFEDALSLLRQPNPGDFFTQKAAKGKTIGDLVQHMLKKGVVFAPAVAGDEAAYLAIHRALAAYAAAANTQVVAEKPEKDKTEK